MRLIDVVSSIMWASHERLDNQRGISNKDVEETVLFLTDEENMDKNQLRRVTKKLSDRLAYEDEPVG